MNIAGTPSQIDYGAFISYRQAYPDKDIAERLHRLLETYRTPSALVKKGYPKRLGTVFRDNEELSASADLTDSIIQALNTSRFLIVVCSPRTLESKWVKREIQVFQELGKSDRILALLIEGEPRDSCPSALFGKRIDPDTGREEDIEPLAADIRVAVAQGDTVAGQEQEIARGRFTIRSAGHLKKVLRKLDGVPKLKLLAPILDCRLDELVQRDMKRRAQRKLITALAGVAATGLVVVAVERGLDARQKRKIAWSEQLANQSEQLQRQQANLLPEAVYLAAAAMRTNPSLPADQALYRSLSLLGPKPAAERSYTGLQHLVLSPAGKYIVQIPWDGPALIEDTLSGETIVRLINRNAANEHYSRVTEVSFSSDGKSVATRSELGMSVFVWGLPGAQELFRTPAKHAGVISMALSGEGNYLATGHTDGLVRVWDIARGKEVLHFAHSVPKKLKFSPDGRVVAVTSSLGYREGIRDSSPVSMVRLWDITKDQEIALLEHESAVTHFDFSPDGRYLATTSRVGADQEKRVRIGKLNVWDTGSGGLVKELDHEEEVNGFTFTLDAKYLVTASSDGFARMWSLPAGEVAMRIDHGNYVERAGFIRVGESSYIATFGDDGVVRLWNLSLPVLERLRFFESPRIQAFARDADGQYIATISYDLAADAAAGSPKDYRRVLRVWSTASVKAHLPLEHENLVGSARFSPNDDGSYIATLDLQFPNSQLNPETRAFEFTDLGTANVNLWDVSTRNRIAHLEHPAAAMSIEYATSGKHLATACVDGRARVFDALTGKEVSTFEHDGWVYELRFSPDDRYLATSSGKPELLSGGAGLATAAIWDWQARKETARLQSNKIITALAFSSDGRFFAAGGEEGVVRVLPIAENRKIRELRHEEPIKALAFSPDGRFLATGTGRLPSENSPLPSGTTNYWSIADEHQKILRVHTNWTLGIGFSPDGEYLASIDGNGWIGIWATEDGREITSIQHETQNAEAKVYFSPDSNHLITAFSEYAQVWEVTTGREVARRQHPVGYLWDAVFSPDGKYIATAGTDLSANLWTWRPEDLIEEACARLPGNLSPARWHHYVGEAIPYQVVCDNLPVPRE